MLADGDAQDSGYRYVVDFGRNFQGNINISFGSGSPGQQVVVLLGEQLLTNGSVKYIMESHNTYRNVWSLGGAESFVPHEYCEFRWAEVVGAPEPPTHERVAGWQVHYPFDGELNEHGVVMHPPMQPGVQVSEPGVTTFNSSLPDLNEVWALVQHTMNAAAIDLNTDSNTRQRDLCTLDAFVATRYQGGIAPATARHLRRRVTQSMFDSNGYVNFWTEFLVSHAWALHDYTLEYRDTDLAAALWDSKPINVSHTVGIDNYSLLAYYDETDGLVHSTPKPLVDWVRSSTIDTDIKAASHCNELCVQMNAYASMAQGWMADLADRIGPSLSKEAKAYAARSETIRMAAHDAFVAKGANCSTLGPAPPSVPPFVATCGSAWEKDTANHHHNSNGSLALNCGVGHIIEAVVFADYGNAIGDCSTGFSLNKSCHSPLHVDAKEVVAQNCVGMQYCYLQASDDVFGDGCKGMCKRLTVQVSCKNSLQSSSPSTLGVTSSSNETLTCYMDQTMADSKGSPYTSATATSLGALARLPGSAQGVLSLVPYLAARQGRRGPAHGLETSGWMTGFMLEGVYSAAGEIGEGPLAVADVAAAANFGHDTITNTGENSWLGMIRLGNATMTMESWPGGGGGTYSHPWTASPAWIVPRFVMGVRPLEDGWARVAIRPLPAKALTTASVAMLTPQGQIRLAFSLGKGTFAASVTIPGNTYAHVCLPRYLFGAGAKCSITVNEDHSASVDAGGLTCLSDDVGGGVHDVELTCV